VEVHEEALAEPKALIGVQTLRARGHATALDGYSRPGADATVLGCFGTVKLDIASRQFAELSRLVREMKGRGLKLIASGVSTVEQFERCITLGFE